MLTIYAKSLSGEITPLSAPAQNTWRALRPLLARIVCPEDPTRLVLLPGPEEKKDDLERDNPHWGLFHEWKDGDSLFYLVNDPPVYQIIYPKYPPRIFHYLDNKTPYYLIEILIYPSQDIVNSSESFSIKRYSFLFSYKDNTFLSGSDFETYEDDEDEVLSIKRHATRWTSLYEMIQKDCFIPDRFRARIYRSAYRKWSNMLRDLSRSISMEPRRRLTDRMRERQEECLAIRELYHQFRKIPPPYPRKQ